jgi:mycobactin phenyloxazoline synthetase
MTRDELRHSVADMLGEPVESVGLTENLIELGFDSIMLMGLTNRLRKRGIEVSFAELAERPTLAEWWELLSTRAALAERQPARAGDLVDPTRRFPLALMQHAYWIGRSDGQALGSVAAHLYVEFDGRDVQPDRLAAAVEALLRRHAMLRVAIGDDGTQRVLAEPPGPALTVHDFRRRPVEEVEAGLAGLRGALSHQMLPIERGQVLDIRLSLLPDGRTRLHLDVDMVAADAMSYRILLGDLAKLYARPDQALSDIGYSFAQYLADRPAVRGAAHERDRLWWAERLGDLPGAPQLPAPPRSPSGTATPAAQPSSADRVSTVRKHYWLSSSEKARLIERAHRHGVTPAMALAAIFAEVVGAWSAEPRFLLNLPLFNREPLHPDVDSLVGDFTGSVLLDVDLTHDLPFVNRVRDLQARLHTAGAHAGYSGVEVLRDLSRSRGEQALAPIVYTSALNLGELFDTGVRDCFGEPVWIISQGPQVLLDAQVTEVNGGLLLNWDIREAGFPDGVADAMFSAYRDMIARLADPDADWRRPASIGAPADQLDVRRQINATQADTSGRLLHEGFFTNAGRVPDAPALNYGADGTLTYGELADRALRVAACMVERGVRPGDPVSVELAKGPGQAIAVLGVLAAGAVYVPIGTDQPAARRQKIRRAAGVRVAITDHDTGASEVGIETAAGHPRPLARPVLLDPQALAYLLFTSGSTGEPKGVEVPHRAAMNTIDDLIDRYALGPADASLAVSALDFDLSVFDLFGPWSAGGRVVCLTEDARRDASQWAENVRAWGVTVINCVPSVLEMLLNAGTSEGWASSLRVALLGGDWVGTHLPALLHRHAPGCRFVALGGTTETAIHSTVCEVSEVPAAWRAIPYGTPMRNVACRVVDEHGRDRPDWVTGELWIGGPGVARGYRQDPDRTADRFLERDGVRWYRTGDLARYWPDGTLEFLGRRDHQVKVRGFRIELAEVEAALEQHPAVQRAIAAVVGGDRPRLAAAALTDAGEQSMRDGVRLLLPPHMVPEYVVPLSAFPLTANGKVDRRAVTALIDRAGAGVGSHVAPRTALERLIAQVAGEVLGAARVSADADFFGLGGDSVLATALVARLREALDTTDIPVRVIFAHRTIEQIAQHLTPWEAVAQIYLDVSALSDSELDARLAATP